MRTVCLGWVASAFLLTGMLTAANAADELEKQLVKQAPEILKTRCVMTVINGEIVFGAS